MSINGNTNWKGRSPSDQSVNTLYKIYKYTYIIYIFMLGCLRKSSCKLSTNSDKFFSCVVSHVFPFLHPKYLFIYPKSWNRENKFKPIRTFYFHTSSRELLVIRFMEIPTRIYEIYKYTYKEPFENFENFNPAYSLTHGSYLTPSHNAMSNISTLS